MIPGPYQIISCPHCKGLAKYRTLRTGNTLQSTYWSDGKQVSPMLPRPPAVVKCQYCTHSFWLAEAEKVGTYETLGPGSRNVDPEWTAVKQVEEPNEEEYYSAIESNLAKDGVQEKHLRILAWWRRNDAFRDVSCMPEKVMADRSGACRHNMEALLKLIDQENDADRLMQGEILRELGQFDAARQVLNSVVSAKYAAAVRQILLLCASEDTRVCELQICAK